MLRIIICLGVVYALLQLDNYLALKKILQNEARRKFVHITVGIFVASWPWLLSWRTIQVIGAVMAVVVYLNRQGHYFKFNKGLKRESYGDYLFALAIVISALLTHTKIFFAVAILHLALADGLAAIIGQNYGMNWRYKVFGQVKTVVGTMTFWLVSLGILGVGSLFAHNALSYSSFGLIIVLLPPLLSFVENFSIKGTDNITIPVVLILALRLVQLA
jgi:dolichol kinase